MDGEYVMYTNFDNFLIKCLQPDGLLQIIALIYPAEVGFNGDSADLTSNCGRTSLCCRVLDPNSIHSITSLYLFLNGLDDEENQKFINFHTKDIYNFLLIVNVK